MDNSQTYRGLPALNDLAESSTNPINGYKPWKVTKRKHVLQCSYWSLRGLQCKSRISKNNSPPKKRLQDWAKTKGDGIYVCMYVHIELVRVRADVHFWYLPSPQPLTRSSMENFPHELISQTPLCSYDWVWSLEKQNKTVRRSIDVMIVILPSFHITTPHVLDTEYTHTRFNSIGRYMISYFVIMYTCISWHLTFWYPYDWSIWHHLPYTYSNPNTYHSWNRYIFF